MQRIPLTSKERKSMGSVFFVSFFVCFLTERKQNLHQKKLLEFGWIPLDPGNRQWKRRVGAVIVQSVAFSLASVLHLEKTEKTELQGKGLGVCYTEQEH